jgi:peptide/nickel transport system substrate-binding protein
MQVTIMNKFKILHALLRAGVLCSLVLGSMSWPAAAPADTALLRVGLLDEPKTLNPFAARDIWAAKVLLFCYQDLYYYDPVSGEPIPWLAAGPPLWDPQALTVTIPLRTARWDDGTPFTAEDAVFTFEVIKRFRIPKHWNTWEFIEKAEAIDRHTVRYTLKEASAVLWDRTLTSFVVQKSRWSKLVAEAEKALREELAEQKTRGASGEEALTAALVRPLQILTARPVTPESLGPYTFQEWRRGAFVYLKRNERFFARHSEIAGYKVGPHFDGLLFKIYGNMDTAVLALKKGDIDYLWWSIETGYLKDLQKDPEVRIFRTLRGGYRFMGFNLRRSTLRDRDFRKAVAYLVDKDFIVQRILHGEGVRLDTLVPPDPPLYFNPDTPTYGEGLSWKARVAKARDLLYNAGYRWEIEPVGGSFTGQYEVKGSGLKGPDGEPVPSLTLYTPPADYDAQRAQAGSLIQKWLMDFGIPIYWRPMSFGAMTKKVKADHDFDTYISGWSVGRDPDYLRSFFHSRSDRPNGQNAFGYHNTEFDRLADRQTAIMDIDKRRQVVFRLQEILMKDLPCLPLYVPMNLEGTRSDRTRGWVQMTGGIGNLWSFLQVKRVGK